MKPIIKIKNLNFTYNRGKDNEFQALININLEIYPEEFVIVFGPSGCGKSTLLHVMAGLELPDNGNIIIFERDLMQMEKKDFAAYHRAQVGMIYQQYNLITSLTVLENVSLPQLFVNVRKGRRERWAKTLLQRFGILKQAKKIPSELSGGQQQRIGIARAIVNNPKLILADEPIGNLDSISAKNVLDILDMLNEKEKKTVILVTHNPEYLHYGDRIIYMKDGIITREVINRDKHKGKKTEKIHKPKDTAAEIEDLMRAYHGLAPEQINILIMPYKAKAFAHHFISSRNMEETKILEEVIQRRLMGTVSQEEFFDILHKSSPEGGVGFDIRTAEKIIRRVNRIIRTSYFVYQQGRQRKDLIGKRREITDEDKAEKVAWYLLKTCYNKFIDHLDEVQINRIQQAVKDRMSGVILKQGFYEYLDKPFRAGGVGLNIKTARTMTEEIELILILGFGIVQTTTAPGPKKESDEDTKDKEGGPSPTPIAPPQSPGISPAARLAQEAFVMAQERIGDDADTSAKADKTAGAQIPQTEYTPPESPAAPTPVSAQPSEAQEESSTPETSPEDLTNVEGAKPKEPAPKSALTEAILEAQAIDDKQKSKSE